MLRRIQNVSVLLVLILAVPLFAAPVFAVKTQKTYVLQAQHQLDALSARLNDAEKRMNHLAGESREDCAKSIQAIRKKERLARARLDGIRKAGSSEWLTLRKQEDVLLVSLQKSYTHLKNQYFH